jgi:branched-chain amino acid transport system ATP-binding protein
MLKITGLTVAFDGLRALSDVSLDVAVGEIVGLVGPNGAGKSTLLNVASGLIRASAGRVRFEGRDITGTSASRIARLGMARTFQLVQPFRGLTALECVTLGSLYGSDVGRPSGVRAARLLAERELEAAGLSSVAHVLCDALNASQRRRVEIARALASRPQLILMDESLSGLNSVEIEEGVNLIKATRARGVTILIIEHLVGVMAAVADRIVVLDHGEKIFEGPPAAALADGRAGDVYFGNLMA